MGRPRGSILIRSQAFEQGRANIFKRGDRDCDRTAEDNFRASLRSDIGRIRDRETEMPAACVVGKDHRFTHEAPSKTINKRRRSQEVRQGHTWASIIRGHLVGEFVGGKIARLPKGSN